MAPLCADGPLESLAAMPELMRDYFEGSGRSLQEYFRFPEMQQIKNPVHEYFRLGRIAFTQDWIQEGTMPIEAGDDGWVFLGAEHQELAKIAVSRSGSRHYCAVPFGDSYLGPVLRTSSLALGAGTLVAKGGYIVARTVVTGISALVYNSRPYVPPPDAPLKDRFLEESVDVDGSTWWFRVWVPSNLQSLTETPDGVPAFLLLHGFKECGWDNWWQTQSGLGTHLSTSEAWANWFPGIVVMPQLPRRPCDEDWWEHWRAPEMQRTATACLEKAVAKYRVNRKRLYLIGESLGTEGAWYLASAKPGLFAAVGGSCGSVEPYNWSTWEWGSSPESYRKLAEGIGRQTPMWICHGAEDDFVPIAQAKRFVAAMAEVRAASTFGSLLGREDAGEVIFKEYDLDHHVWDHAYSDGLIQWMAAQTK